MSDDLPDEMTDEGFSGDPAEDEIEGGELEEAMLEDGDPEEPVEDGKADADEDEDEAGARPPMRLETRRKTSPTRTR